MTPERSSPNQSVQRAVAILRAVSDAADGLALAELTRTVALPRPTVIRFVQALEDERLLAREPGSRRIVLGMELARIAAGYVRGRELLAVARSYVEELAAKFGEALEVSAIANERDEDVDRAVDVLFRIESTRSLQVSAQGPAPLHATSVGKLLLAQWPQAELEAYLARPLSRLARRTITDPRRLRIEVQAARTSGVAAVVDELEDGISGLASGICDEGHKLIGVLHLEAPTARMGRQRQAEVLDLMAVAASAIEAELLR
jgi:IclR family acetate operon transcriptional repressor